MLHTTANALEEEDTIGGALKKKFANLYYGLCIGFLSGLCVGRYGSSEERKRRIDCAAHYPSP